MGSWKKVESAAAKWIGKDGAFFEMIRKKEPTITYTCEFRGGDRHFGIFRHEETYSKRGNRLVRTLSIERISKNMERILRDKDRTIEFLEMDAKARKALKDDKYKEALDNLYLCPFITYDRRY